MDINLSQAINRALDTRPKDAPRNYVGASSIGHDCARAIWYQAHGEVYPCEEYRYETISG